MNRTHPAIPLLPLAGFAITGLLGRGMAGSRTRSPCGPVVASWLVAMVVAFGALAHVGIAAAGRRHQALGLDPRDRLPTPTSASSLIR